MPRYYVEMDGHAYGPFDRDELAQLRDDGILSGNSTAREEHSSDGVPLNELLQSIAGSSASVQTAPPGPEAASAAPPASPQPPAQPEPETPANDEPQPVAASQSEFSAPPSSTGETWSERLSRLRSSVTPPQPGSTASESAEPSGEEEEDGVWAPKDTAGKPAPDFLVPQNADIEEGIQYKSALGEADSPEEEGPSNDGFLPSLGFKLAPSAPDPTAGKDSSELPPLGGQEAIKASAPSSWSAGTAGTAPEVAPPAPAAGLESQISAPKDEKAAPPAAPIPASEDSAPSAFEGPGPEWKQRMAQLDVIYGRPEGERAGRPVAAGQAAPPQTGMQAPAPSAGSASERPEKPGQSSPLLAGLALVVVGGMALMSGWNYVSLAKGPGLMLAAAMAAFAGLSINGGLLVWMRVKWAVIVMGILLLVPLAVAVASCYYFKEDLLNLVIPASLQKPLMYDVVAMIVGAVGLASLPKRARNVGEGD